MIENKNVLVLGMARSGIAIAKLLVKYHNQITITDIKEQEENVLKELQDLKIKVIITKKQEDLVDETIDIIIKNPAIRKDHKALQKARKLKIPIINEMEASYHYLPKDVKIIGITGSNGKTTTTTMIYEILKRANLPVHLGGNIGYPLASLISEIKEKDILVLEISDHQLCDMYEFKTDISVLTNLSEVHLDFHGSYEKYKKIKKRIFNNHTKDSIAIVNADDPEVLKITKNIPSKKLYFSFKKCTDAYVKEEGLIYKEKKIMDTKNMFLKGKHNYENALAAILTVKIFAVKDDIIKTYLKEFKGVEHRLEYVCQKNGRTFYNDSKATNNQSTITALSSFETPIRLIMGGLDRNIPFEPLAPYLKNVKTILCYGETKEKIKNFALKNHKEVFVVNTLEEATKKAYEKSQKGDTILLSPACASWDQYPDFETRGKEFKTIVEKLK